MTRAASPYAVEALTTDELALLMRADAPVAALVPVGALEPHGPHLGLGTDLAISEEICRRAAPRLDARGVAPVVGPGVPFGVTRCAAPFAGAVSVPADVLARYLGAVADGFTAQGARAVCLVNNHLEPAHERAVREAAEGRPGRVCVASPLERSVARTLSEEFRRGACHAGRYETSLALAGFPDLVRDELRSRLPEVNISLSRALAAGAREFSEMGLARAYAGAPAKARAEEGEGLADRLADAVVSRVLEMTTGGSAL